MYTKDPYQRKPFIKNLKKIDMHQYKTNGTNLKE